MVDENTLRNTFWLLKKYSSYTWAAEIHKHFTRFVNELEAWMRTNPPAATTFEEDVLRSVWYMQGKAEEGLNLLRNGKDKARAYSLLSDGFGFANLFWADRWFMEHDPVRFTHLGFSADWTKKSTGLFFSLGAADRMLALAVFGPYTSSYKYLLNPKELDRVYGANIADLHQYYSTPLWMPAEFPLLPALNEDIHILSGQETPYTGIWIPTPLVSDSISAKLLQKPVGQQTYCMSFMVQGTVAPKMISEEEHLLVIEQNCRPIPKDRAVRWRLLWKDERYGENGIPEEEKDYLRVDEAAPAPTERADSGVIRCEGGKSCPRSGYWHVWHEAGTRRYFNEGDSMPGGLSSQGERIWYWDEDQST